MSVERFQRWLTHARPEALNPAAAQTYAQLGREIERRLGVSLDEALRTREGLTCVLAAIEKGFAARARGADLMQAARAVIAADKLKTVARAYREYLASEGKVSAGGVAGLVARVWTSLFAPLTSRANTYRRRDGCITQSAS